MSRIRLRLLVGLALAVAVALAAFASPYASSSPDGLEKVAETNGFLDDGRLHALQESSPSRGVGRGPPGRRSPASSAPCSSRLSAPA